MSEASRGSPATLKGDGSSSSANADASAPVQTTTTSTAHLRRPRALSFPLHRGSTKAGAGMSRGSGNGVMPPAWRNPEASTSTPFFGMPGGEDDEDKDDDYESSVSSYAGSDAATSDEESSAPARSASIVSSASTSTASIATERAPTETSNTEPMDGDFSSAEYVTSRLLQAFDAVMLDRVVVVQAQSSGLLNARARELEQVAAQATRKMQQTRASYVEGLRIIKEVQKDLKWVQRHVDAVKRKVAARYVEEYAEARRLIPEIIDRQL
ncbi:uncharacterized protein V1518DRAFT_418483 [Limtongia smithiae]|uniref:uncharacterized protein n=1 Tax=Limtongia smithiae TaxID=1125753 RepID=UPI0034CF88A2